MEHKDRNVWFLGVCDCMLPTNPPMKLVDGELLNTRPDLSLCVAGDSLSSLPFNLCSERFSSSSSSSSPLDCFALYTPLSFLSLPC